MEARSIAMVIAVIASTISNALFVKNYIALMIWLATQRDVTIVRSRLTNKMIDPWSIAYDLKIRYSKEHSGVWSEIPLAYKRRSGLPPDELADNIKRECPQYISYSDSEILWLLTERRPAIDEPLVRVHKKQPRCGYCGKYMTIYDRSYYPINGECHNCCAAIQSRDIKGRWKSTEKEL